ncbi:MAG: LamG-like jellyroll fold domain-containing protein, partial [Anaerolineales bacterium]
MTFFVLVLALVSANTAFGGIVIEKRTEVENDVGEDHIAYPGQADDGAESRGSSDLEMPWEGDVGSSSYQVIGLRFVDLNIPKGSKVIDAYVQFTADDGKITGGPVNLIINGLLQPDTDDFTSGENFWTERNPKTNAEVAWSDIPDWVGFQATDASRTPDISSIIQEIIDQDGWASDNALMLFIRDDENNPSAATRNARSDGEGADNEPLLHIELSSNQATQPDPADGVLYEDTWVNMAWAMGDTAASHDVYMGDNFTDVNDGTGDTFRGNTTYLFYMAGFLGYPFPDGLVPGTTYYWRIDEVEADGVTKHKGFVWSFIVPTKTAYNSEPVDGYKFAAPDATLSWTAGFGAKVHYVYFGTSFDEVNDDTGAIPQPALSYNPGPLADNTAYYWRVDEFDGFSTYKGNVWSFRTMPIITITDPDLIGWWKFDEGSGSASIDWSGYGNDATLGGDPDWVEGVMDGALNLTGPSPSGSDDYVSIDAVADDLTSNDFTLSAWIKTTQAGEGNVFASNTGGSHVLLFGIDGGDVYVDDGPETTFPPAVNDDQWHMITFVKDGSRITIYTDAVQVGTLSTTVDV